MKKELLFVFIILCIPMTGFAHGDSLKVEKTDSMQVIRISESSVIDINDGKVHMDFDIPFYDRFSRKKTKMDLHMLGFGAMKSFSESPFSFNTSKSLDIFAFCTDDLYMGESWFFSWGAGIEWKTFTLTGDTAMYKASDGKIVTGPYPEGSVPKLSRLRVFSFGIPLLFSCNVWNGFGFSFGPVIDLNVDSCINQKYYYSGSKQKDKYKHVHCNFATVDLMFQLNLKEVGIWMKYSPVSLMDKAYWPDIQTLSFGIAL